MTNISAPTRKLRRCFTRLYKVSQRNRKMCNLKKPKIPKSVRLTKLQTLLPKTMFQQQGMAAVHFERKRKRQSPQHNSCNRSVESQNQTTVSQTTQTS